MAKKKTKKEPECRSSVALQPETLKLLHDYKAARGLKTLQDAIRDLISGYR